MCNTRVIQRAVPVVKGITGAIFFACLTGLAAQIRIPLPFTPVPLTLQVFAVLFSGALLGSRYGSLSQLVYLAAGVAGLPFFSGISSGTAVLLGSTGGYIIGFIPAAYIVGALVKRPKSRIGIISFMMLAVAVIYLFGAIWFAAVTGSNFNTTLKLAVIPFAGFDLAKAFAASFLIRK
ncbi:MAG: hypothetical protein COV46_05150 [Deltaproteobacteria bacterium CG11_big_fil_rev_8_21_14_0_20_49_13]|nr:MAG: hypothetical protein COV46_05150 [Deltaproteobacteria bacterium CG11_big_fil_rev_8_21_14_0_20_49_13]